MRRSIQSVGFLIRAEVKGEMSVKGTVAGPKGSRGHGPSRLSGTEVVAVEGLARPTRQHPDSSTWVSRTRQTVTFRDPKTR